MGEKKKWLFKNYNGRKPLSREEVSYWRTQMEKILKVGQEFEFNLPQEQNGHCKSDNASCPCIYMTDEHNCWKTCAGCTYTKNTLSCANVTPVCTDEDCEVCEHFKLKCEGVNCSGFISSCLTCLSFERGCDTCSNRYDPEKSPEFIRSFLSKKLQPNNTYGVVSKTGVHKVTTDGSLLGGTGKDKGAEIITIGRRIDYWEFYKMAKNIIDEATTKGAFLDERCSLHMHVLTSHYITNNQFGFDISEMEKEMPEIILANFHQLCRKYQNAITWMTSGLNEYERMTRWEKYRMSILDISASDKHMADVRYKIESRCYKPKYGWVNYHPTVFNNNNNVSRFHVEMRVADGLLSPSAVAAIACMYYALVVKAVELSRFGVLVIDSNWLGKALCVKDALLNNTGDWDQERFGDTSNLSQYYGILEEESLELVHQLKNILLKVGPAYEVLEKLATAPCGLKRCRGKNWDEIEQELAVFTSDEDKIDIILSEVITLLEVSKCSSLEEWVSKTTNYINDPDYQKDDLEQTIKYYVQRKSEVGELVWSDRLGTPIFV